MTIPLATGLLYASHKYQLSNLLNSCKAHLKANIEPTNVLSILNQCVLCNEQELVDLCMDTIAPKAGVLLSSESLLELSYQALLLVVQSDGLRVHTERQVYDACMRWAIDKCVANDDLPSDQLIREKLGKILHHIRFPSMPLADFSEISKKSDVLTKKEKMEIFQNIASPSTSSTFKNNPRWVPFPNEIVHVFVRFTSSQPQAACSDEQVFGVSFSVDKEVLCSGIGMLACNIPIDASVRIYDSHKNLLSEISKKGLINSHPLCLRNNIGRTVIFPLHFTAPVLIHGNTIYTVIAKVQFNPKTNPNKIVWIGSGNENIMRDGNLTITFSEAVIDGIRYSGRVIPALFFVESA